MVPADETAKSNADLTDNIPNGDILSLDAIQAHLEEKVELFNAQIPNEPKFAKFVALMEKTVMVQIGDEVGFVTRLANSTLEHFSRVNLPIDTEHDIIIMADHPTMSGMLSGTLKPIKAYATKKLRLKAQVKDVLFLKKLLAKPKN